MVSASSEGGDSGRRTSERNVCDVDEVEARKKRLKTLVGQSELRVVRTKERAKDRSVRVPDGSSFLSDVE